MALKSSRDDNYLKQPFCSRFEAHLSLRDEGVRGWEEAKGLANKKGDDTWVRCGEFVTGDPLEWPEN